MTTVRPEDSSGSVASRHKPGTPIDILLGHRTMPSAATDRAVVHVHAARHPWYSRELAAQGSTYERGWHVPDTTARDLWLTTQKPKESKWGR